MTKDVKDPSNTFQEHDRRRREFLKKAVSVGMLPAAYVLGSAFGNAAWAQMLTPPPMTTTPPATTTTAPDLAAPAEPAPTPPPPTFTTTPPPPTFTTTPPAPAPTASLTATPLASSAALMLAGVAGADALGRRLRERTDPSGDCARETGDEPGDR